MYTLNRREEKKRRDEEHLPFSYDGVVHNHTVVQLALRPYLTSFPYATLLHCYFVA